MTPLSALQIAPFVVRVVAGHGSVAQWQRGLPQTSVRLSKVPEERCTIAAIDFWIEVFLSRDLASFASSNSGIGVD